MALPSSTALTIVAKLSSAKIISDASLATSVPAIPIAIPILAYFKAGASLTPSPVIAAIWFNWPVSNLTNSLLWDGSVLENTSPLGFPMTSCKTFFYFSSPIVENSKPVNEWVANWATLCKIPIYIAMDYAVSLISPVIMITEMPASLHLSIEFLTSGLGGSCNATTPIIMGLFSSSL